MRILEVPAILAAWLLLAGGAPIDARAETDPAAPASEVARAGRDDYVRHCAACHGLDADGTGPAASALSKSPPDLTRIAQRRGGEFPVRELAALIDGRGFPSAHGSREMPIWGQAFAEIEAGDEMAEQIVAGRVLTLLLYLRSIQR